MTLEPLNGIPLISEASKSKLYAFSLGSDRIRLITLRLRNSARSYLKQVAMTACKETFREIIQNTSLDFSLRKLVQGRVQTNSPRHVQESLHVSGKLPTYPSHKLTLTLTSHLEQNVGLGDG